MKFDIIIACIIHSHLIFQSHLVTACEECTFYQVLLLSKNKTEKCDFEANEKKYTEKQKTSSFPTRS